MVNIIKIDMGIYDHWALETNTLYEGKPTLISNTSRNKTVREESWGKVVGNRPYKRIVVKTNEPAYLVLSKARAAIGKIKYCLFSYNCEHFIREILTGTAESKQLQRAFWGISLIAMTTVLYVASRRRAL